MEHLLHKFAEDPVMSVALGVIYLFGWLLFRRRVRREESPDYVRPPLGGGIRKE